MTAVWFFAAVALPGWGAYALVAACSRALPQSGTTTILRLCLGLGVGWGWGSATYYLWLRAFGRPQGMYLAVDALFWFLLSFLFRADRPPGAAESYWHICGLLKPFDGMSNRDEHVLSHGKVRRTVRQAFAVVLAVALTGLVGQALAAPNGGWDAWAIWNLRARSLYRLGDDWPQAFAGTFHHIDYPLLVPGTLARCWTFLGDDPNWAGAVLGIAFTLATVTVVVAAVAQRRGADAGMFAGMVLMGTTRFLRWGALQYADVPLSFFFLLTLVLLMRHDELLPVRHPSTRSLRDIAEIWQAAKRIVSPSPVLGSGLLLLAGMTTGLAAWTKNEGLLFTAVVLLVVPAWAVCQRGWRAGLHHGALVLTGAAPALALVLLFKAHVPISNDLVAGQGLAATLERVIDPARHFKIVLASLTTGLQVAHLFAAVIPICFLLLGRKRFASTEAGRRALPVAVIGLMVAGYYGIYLTTPHDLDWHLATSLDRLIVQLWPMVVLTIFLELRSPEEALAQVCGPGDTIEQLAVEPGTSRRAA